eukprot:1394795-Rhodomonas_salina.1
MECVSSTEEVFEESIKTKTQPKQRAVLGKEAVLIIFSSRPRRSDKDGTFLASTESSKGLAATFDISDKTVREIWNRKSWAKTTRPLWTPAEVASTEEHAGMGGNDSLVIAQTRRPGRPRGSKDTVSRKRKRPDEKAEHVEVEEEEYDDSGQLFPFVRDWLHAMKDIDLTTMVDADDVLEVHTDVFAFLNRTQDFDGLD